MLRIARKTFDWIVCTGALSLPVIAVVLALESGGVAIRAAVPAESRPAESAATAAAAEPALPAAAHSSLSYRTSWIGNTWGYKDQRWVQIDVEALAVTPQGDVFTNTPWDEGGGEIGHYRDGQLLGYAGESHGWGMGGGDAIAVNDDYVFAAQTVSSLGDKIAAEKNLPPKDTIWYGVSRRNRADFRNGAPFAGQVRWPSRNAFLRVIVTSPGSGDFAIRGLAADATRLFVSNPRDNRVEIFDARSMQPVGSFPVHEPGKLAIAPDGTLWIIEDIRTDNAQRIVHHARDGVQLGSLALPPGTVPTDLTLDARGRLLVADNGPRQQVLIFTAAADSSASPAWSSPASTASGNPIRKDASMQLSATFGETGGIYAGRAGKPGPLRFNGLTGVGVDRAGNIYVSMNGSGLRGFEPGPNNSDGTLIESYTPAGRQRFSLQSLLFVDGAEFAGGNPPSVYSGSKRFVLDLSRPAGQEWSYAGHTADRFRYPYDPFFRLKQGQRGMPLVRDVDGHRLLFTTDMASMYLRIYRFADDRETAIPAGFFARAHIDGAWPPNQPAHGEWIWRDTAGQGRFARGDFDQNAARSDAPDLQAWWVDSNGDVWQGTKADGVRRFPLQGFDRTGNPLYRYAAMQTWPTPAPLNRISRLNYFPADDTMFISGSTPARPYNEENWNGTGSTLVRYDHWKSGHPVLRYAVDLPDQGPPDREELNGFAVEGDYIFAGETLTGIIRVYDRDTGRDIGRLAPGPEVGRTSGWLDVAMPITAHRLASGEYLVFVEDDAHGKAMMYRFSPPARTMAANRAALD